MALFAVLVRKQVVYSPNMTLTRDSKVPFWLVDVFSIANQKTSFESTLWVRVVFSEYGSRARIHQSILLLKPLLRLDSCHLIGW